MSLRPLAQTTTYAYDQASNKIKETRPDLKFRTWDTFDNRNRVKHMTGFLGDGTSYVYDFAGNMTQMTDSKGAIYGFGYDYLSRKTSATYPVDAGNVVRNETWSYDEAGNLVQYKNPNDQIQQIHLRQPKPPDRIRVATGRVPGHHHGLRRRQPRHECGDRRWHYRWLRLRQRQSADFGRSNLDRLPSAAHRI